MHTAADITLTTQLHADTFQALENQPELQGGHIFNK